VSLIDFSAREITIKLVYYGPALAGKTTNLRMLHARAAAQSGRLMSLDTEKDRTLFFDLLPLRFRSPRSGSTVRLKIYTVPGQVIHNATRRIVLRGVDGVVFVADSQLREADANNTSFANLRQNLLDNGLDPNLMPTVIQYNKRDLPDICTEAELAQLNTREDRPVFGATAVRDEGVLPTFFACARLAWDALDRRGEVMRRLGLDRGEFFERLGVVFGNRA
jgi:mutual gliding-motility protein MglA